jgi:hypothetical protein
VLSLPHPSFALIDADDPDRRVRRSYWDRAQVGGDQPRTIAELFTSLARANFRIDAVVEPEPATGEPRSSAWAESMAWVPSTLIIRARKQGL